MPDRIIRDRARRSPTLQRQSNASERAWWRLEVACDDYGRFDAEVDVLIADLFPRRPRGWTSSMMRAVLQEWTRPGEDGDPELVHLYRVDGDRRVYGHAITFLKHQRERGSKPKFPDPPCGGSPQDAAKCRESLQVAAPSESREPRAESREPSSSPRGDSPQGAPFWPSPNALVALYNAETPDECPAVTKLSPARRKKAQAALAAFPDREWWVALCRRARGSRFLRGLKPNPGHEGFVLDFDWLLSKGKDGTENAVKVAEGRYDDRG